ncbi:MAG: hypothetical protein P0107_02645 [Nitrosomonas sp.]|nr:hypothetical protein [Nitrosomonas sp.]
MKSRFIPRKPFRLGEHLSTAAAQSGWHTSQNHTLKTNGRSDRAHHIELNEVMISTFICTLRMSGKA